jgi:2-isopropylmalate synthase
VERCNQLPVHPRHPYAGDLVYTAFSGSHQDAIRKGFAQQAPDAVWEVPYLPVDPADVGRSYDAVIRVNSQSGKGGSTYLLERGMGFTPSRRVQIEFSHVVQAAADRSGLEMTSEAICALFTSEYFEAQGPAQRVNALTVRWNDRDAHVATPERRRGQSSETQPAESPEEHAQRVVAALAEAAGLAIEVTSVESARAADGRTAVFVGCRVGEQSIRYGVGCGPEVEAAVMDAVVSAVNRANRVNAKVDALNETKGESGAVTADSANTTEDVIQPAWHDADSRVAA